MIRKIIKNKEGITLLELTVAVAIFTVMMLSVTQIFKSVIDGQRSAVAGQNIQESMRYALEVMSKEMRSSQKASGGDCSGFGMPGKVFKVDNGDELYFKNYKDQCVKYELSGNRLQITRDGSADFITPSQIKVINLKFIVVDIVNTKQSNVKMKMEAEALGKEMNKQSIKLQTTISSRFYE